MAKKIARLSIATIHENAVHVAGFGGDSADFIRHMDTKFPQFGIAAATRNRDKSTAEAIASFWTGERNRVRTKLAKRLEDAESRNNRQSIKACELGLQLMKLARKESVRSATNEHEIDSLVSSLDAKLVKIQTESAERAKKEEEERAKLAAELAASSGNVANGIAGELVESDDTEAE